MNKSSKQIKIGAVVSYAALAINIAATLLYMPWMVSVIGKSNYAMYTLAYSFVSIFLFDFGLSSSVSKFVAQYRAEGNIKKENEFISTINKVYLILDIVIMLVLIILFFFIDKIYVRLTPAEITTFKSLYIIVASYAVVSFPFMPLSGIMYAYEKLIESKLCEMFQKLFSIFLVVLALLFQAGVTYVVLANVISALIALVAKYCIVKRGTHISAKLSKATLAMFKEVVAFTIWVAVQSLAQRCIFNIAPTILGMVATSADIAVFGPASSIENYFASVAATINGFFVMRITRYVTENDKEHLYELLLKVGRFQLLLLGMIYTVFVCIGDNFICAWMGTEYRMAWLCAALIMIPDILIFSEQVANTAAIANNLVKYQALGYIIMAIVCVGLSFPLSKAFGAVGSSLAIVVAYTVLFVYNNIFYMKKMKLNMIKFMRECYGRMILPMLAACAVGVILCRNFVLQEGWMGVIIKALIAAIIYTLFMFRSLNDTEKALFLGFLRRREKND